MVLVYSDNKRLLKEILSKAREISSVIDSDVTAVLIGENNDVAMDLIRYGADVVYRISTDLNVFKVEEYSQLIYEVIKETNAKIILIGSNKNGKELAPRVAAMSDVGSITDVTKLCFKSGILTTERTILGGNAICVEESKSYPIIVTIPPGTFEPIAEDNKRSGRIIEKEISTKKFPSKILNVQKPAVGEVNIEEADIIVSAGRGFKRKEDLKLLEELLKALRGGAIGCSRPLAADLKWLTEDHWVGLSGHKVKPKLYIAVGISGQIQHIAGIRDSGTIIAINKDPEALIFKSADYGVVGDLYEVLPKLINVLKKKLN